jgi:hypothetical protein
MRLWALTASDCDDLLVPFLATCLLLTAFRPQKHPYLSFLSHLSIFFSTRRAPELSARGYFRGASWEQTAIRRQSAASSTRETPGSNAAPQTPYPS